MRHEKVLKREDGSKVNIEISFNNEPYSNNVNYRVSISICEPRKRTFIYVLSRGDYSFRRLTIEEKSDYAMEHYLKYVTKEEIMEVAIELWNKMIPTFLNIKT